MQIHDQATNGKAALQAIAKEAIENGAEVTKVPAGVTAATAKRLTKHADEIRALGKRVVADVIEIGKRLFDCRELLKEDNKWRAWLKDELGWSHQTAGRFIQLHELSGRWSNLDHLEIPVSGLYLLAQPSVPETARAEILTRAEAGEAIPVAEVERIIKKDKGDSKTKKKKAKPTEAEEVAPAKTTVITTTSATPAQAGVIISREHAADIVGRIFEDLEILLDALSRHPGWADADHLGERLQTKATAFIELAQRRQAS
jgi:hypothetical protein